MYTNLALTASLLSLSIVVQNSVYIGLLSPAVVHTMIVLFNFDVISCLSVSDFSCMSVLSSLSVRSLHAGLSAYRGNSNLVGQSAKNTTMRRMSTTEADLQVTRSRPHLRL